VRGRIRLQSARDDFQYAVHIVHDIVIPETEDTVVAVAQPLIANSVRRIVCVLTTIDFNNQAPLATDEIDNIGTNRLLTDELAAANRAGA
jgi:hypothetical protein